MTGARHDHSGTWLRVLCTYARDSGFKSYWRYKCDGDETGLNQLLNGGGLVKSCFFYKGTLFKPCSSLVLI